MSEMNKKHCVVVTCFSEIQPGYLDFSYRIKSLAKEYRLTIISQDVLTQSELMQPFANYIPIGRQHGKYGWLSYLWKCSSYIRKCKPELLVLLHSSAAPVSLLVRNIPVCLYWNEHPSNLMRLPNSYSPIKYLLSVLSQHLLYLGGRFSDCIMPIGEEHRDDLYQHRIDPNNTHMIYMGVADEFLLTSHPVEVIDISQPIQLIYIGTVSQARGRDVMLESMAILAKDNVNVHLTIIGACEQQLDFCKQRLLELGIVNYVTLVGRISGEGIPKFLMQADIGICLWENNHWNEFNPPTKLFEYLAAGLPVLASNIRTHTRYIQDWNNGLIFEYDKVSLANAISSLYIYRNRIQSLKNNAKSDGQQYSWSKLEPMFLQSLSHLLSSKVLNK